MRDVRKARLAMLGCVVVAALALAACGGSSGPSASASTAPSTTTGGAGGGGFGAALTAFRNCMSSHGVTLPQRNRGANGTPPSTTPGETRPRTGGGFGFGFGGGDPAARFNNPPAGVDPTKYKDALAACRSTLPTGNGAFQNNSAFAAYRSCLADHGVTLPAAGSAGNTTGTTFSRNDPKVQAAMKTCAPLLPAGGFGRRGGSTTTTTLAPA
ncbi:MAG TPA: hypothetical protein VL119_13510 [Acidimicrobiia bacterium]|nr:hypothetical protein [Acidimicrobiia bacterium]